jgi:Spy/CpxP family protein refolding chaperone
MALCSIAVAAGVVGIVALVKGALFHRRFGRFGHGFGPPWAMAACGPSLGGEGACGRGGPFRHGFGRWRGFGAHGGGPGGSFWLRAIFARLDTTPGQEKEIRAAIEDFQRTAREAKDGLHASREGLAKAIAGETFDEIAIGEASVKIDATAAKVKEAFEAALRRIHAVLDPKQRERLSRLVAEGPRGMRDGWGNHPYRSWMF